MVVNRNLAVVIRVFPRKQRLERRLDLDEKAARLERRFVCVLSVRVSCVRKLTGHNAPWLIRRPGKFLSSLVLGALRPVPVSRIEVYCISQHLSRATHGAGRRSYSRVCVRPVVLRLVLVLAIVDGWCRERINNRRCASGPRWLLGGHAMGEARVRSV